MSGQSGSCGRRAREQETSRDVGRQQTAAPGEDDPTFLLVAHPGRSQIGDARRCRGRGTRAGACAQGQGEGLLGPACRRELLVAGFGRVAPCDRGDRSARACERSTSADRRYDRARRTRSRGTHPRASTGDCAGTPLRAVPSSTLRTTRTPPSVSTSSASAYASAWTSSSGRGRRPAATCRPSCGRGLDGERVRADVLDTQRKDAVERSAPVVERLAVGAVDQIDVDAREPGVAASLMARSTFAGS